jgi:hypothetical protein
MFKFTKKSVQSKTMSFFYNSIYSPIDIQCHYFEGLYLMKLLIYKCDAFLEIKDSKSFISFNLIGISVTSSDNDVGVHKICDQALLYVFMMMTTEENLVNVGVNHS